MEIMKLGCGSGSCTLEFARAVGEQGVLYAVDIQPIMINKLIKKLEKDENKDISNIETNVATAYALPFPESSFDVVCLGWMCSRKYRMLLVLYKK